MSIHAIRISVMLVAAVTVLILGVPRVASAQSVDCQKVMVSMRDGVRLATDVYLPVNQGPGPFPVVLERTPYNKGVCENDMALYFARRGYVSLVQDERGRHQSEGRYYYLVDNGWGERRDGYDTIEWAGTQPWSNGKVGTIGGSFTCMNQYLTAPTRPPHLAAMVCSQTASNPYRELFYTGGAIHLIMPSWLLSQQEMARPFRLNPPGWRGYVGGPDSWTEWYASKQQNQVPFGESMLSEMIRDLVGNPYYNDYWRQLAVDEHWSEIDVPIYHIGSWYDRYPEAQVKQYNGIRQHGGPRARQAQKLLLGPWLHGRGEVMPRVIGDLDFGPEAALNYFVFAERWFDHHLKDLDTGLMDEAPVRVFVMGANIWRDEQEFPLARTAYTDYFLSAGLSGSIDSVNDGALTLTPPGDEEPDRYEYDPMRPVPSIGGDLFVEPRGARDHRPAEHRSLTYTTSPLEKNLEVTGFPVIEFYASSSAVDTDWVVAITDVHPDGYSQILRQNILRARYRDGDEQPTLMKPGEIYKFKIELYPISNLFKKGHRIRIVLSSSSFPKWYPNGNTGREIDNDMPGVVATNTIYHDREHPSRAVLPIISTRPESPGRALR